MNHGIVFTNTHTFGIISPFEFTDNLTIDNIEVINQNTIQLFTSDYDPNAITKVELSLNEDGTMGYKRVYMDSIYDTNDSASAIEILFKQEDN